MRPAPDFRHTVSVGRRSLVLVFLGGLTIIGQYRSGAPDLFVGRVDVESEGK